MKKPRLLLLPAAIFLGALFITGADAATLRPGEWRMRVQMPGVPKAVRENMGSSQNGVGEDRERPRRLRRGFVGEAQISPDSSIATSRAMSTP